MIKLIRKISIENVWVLRIIMIVISVTFVVGMGVVGLSGPGEQYVVARVGDVDIPLERYTRAYDNAKDFYKNLFKEQFNDELLQKLNLKDTVVNGLVENELWLMAAEDLDLAVSDEELTDFITQQESFKNDGKFSAEIYQRVLAANHLSLEAFERSQRSTLLVAKAKTLLKSSAFVTEAEYQKAEAENPPQEGAPPEERQRLRNNLLLHKEQMVLDAYLNSVKARIPIKVEKKML